MAKRFVVCMMCMILLMTAFPATAFAGRSGGRSSTSSIGGGSIIDKVGGFFGKAADTGKAFLDFPKNAAEAVASVSNSLSEIIQKLGIVVLILLVGFIAFLVVTAFGIKGISRVKNNPAALQRLEMMHAHQEKMAQIKTMTHFD